MSDDFLTAEASIENSQPREFFEIVQDSAVTYRVATGVRDIVYNGNTYTAYPAARTDVGVDSVSSEPTFTVSLPLTHALVQRYLAQGSPPRQVLFTLYRQQGALVERYSGGVIVSLAIERIVAKFLVQSQIARLAQRSLPIVSASRFCQHILYDSNCRASRDSFSIATTVASFDGRRVTVASISGNPDQWALYGELVHLPTGGRMPITDQTGAMISLQAPIPEIATGDAVTIAAGCAHDILTCRSKFSNQVNFGGFPQLPTKNPFIPTGTGIVEQS